jgi:acetyl-CoA carboxylase carboxyltransferase component
VAKVILEPVGTPRERAIPETSWGERSAAMRSRVADLERHREHVRQGWGPKYEQRVRDKGKLPTWDRIERLKDPDAPVLPIGTLVNHGREFGGRESPGAGVVTAFTRVHRTWVVVIANDNTVASGSWWPRTPEKIQRAQEVALRMRGGSGRARSSR